VWENLKVFSVKPGSTDTNQWTINNWNKGSLSAGSVVNAPELPQQDIEIERQINNLRHFQK